MMDMMQEQRIENVAQKQPRSRNGCRECRRIRRKCDERKPSCRNCSSLGKLCSYARDLSWGGRPFAKSRFKAALSSGIERIATSELVTKNDCNKPQFVYGAANTSQQSISTQQSQVSNTGITDRVEHGSASRPFGSDLAIPTTILVNPDWKQRLDHKEQHLLHHFLSNITRCFSSHKVLHQQFGSTLLPIAMNEFRGSQLLYAIFYASESHLASLNNTASTNSQLEKSKYNSIAILRKQRFGVNSTFDDVAIATALVLCFAEILTGGEQPFSWRTHLRGAAAMLEASGTSCDIQRCRNIDSIRRFLIHWCKSFELLTLAVGYPIRSSKYVESTPTGHASPHISLFDGFSTTLAPVLAEISRLCIDERAIAELKALNANCVAQLVTLEANLLERAERLSAHIHSMLTDTDLPLDPWILRGVSEGTGTSEFKLLNEVFHYAALLQIYQCVINLASTDSRVVEAVREGIDRLKGISLEDGSCPCVATLHPIFIIGCNTNDFADKLFVLDWMSSMKRLFAMANVDKAKLFLIELWQARDQTMNMQSFLRWDDFQRAKGWDLLLY